jgi:hypothetical protein
MKNTAVIFTAVFLCIDKTSKRFTTRGLQLPKVVQTIIDAKEIISQNDNKVK